MAVVSCTPLHVLMLTRHSTCCLLSVALSLSLHTHTRSHTRSHTQCVAVMLVNGVQAAVVGARDIDARYGITSTVGGLLVGALNRVADVATSYVARHDGAGAGTGTGGGAAPDTEARSEFGLAAPAKH